jgi:hypothetical protein
MVHTHHSYPRCAECGEKHKPDNAEDCIQSLQEALVLAHKDAEDWQMRFGAVAKALGCLPSTFSDGNDHVIDKACRLMTLAGEADG